MNKQRGLRTYGTLFILYFFATNVLPRWGNDFET